MNSNRSQPSRPSVLIVGHGSTVSLEAQAAARLHAKTLSLTNCFEHVVVHFLTSEDPVPDLPAGDVFLLPFFMSEGYFVTTKISEIFGLEKLERHGVDQHIYQCPAIGVDPMLATILTKMVEECCSNEGCITADVDIVLLAHGSSQSPASREATKAQEALLRKSESYNSVSSAFLEEEPSLQSLVRERGKSRKPLIVLGHFAAEGPHAMIDVPTAIEELRKDKRGQDLEIHYAGVVGVRPEIVTLIEQSILRRMGDKALFDT